MAPAAKLASIVLSAAILAVPVIAPVWAAPAPWLDGLARFKPVDAAVQTRGLGPGVNIMSDDPSFDGHQGAVFKDGYFADIAARGFRTVRIPQALVRHAGAGGRPDRRWLAELDRVVREASLSGLNVVIDNNGGCSRDGAVCLERTARIWRRLARHYRRAPNTVLFELYNEPDGAITPQIWNAGLGRILAAIRASNPTRNVVIGTAHAYNLRDLAELKLPDGDRHIIASFHYYEPFSFTHQDAPFLPRQRRPRLGAHFGTPSEIADLNRNFDYVARWSAWYRRPVFMGEFGVLETADPDDRVLWTRTVARAAEARGIAWAYWQIGRDFTVFDLARGTWNEPLLRALIP